MISKEGRKFIEGMRVYLVSRGIGDSEIESFLAEAETHIIEGEKHGKTVQDIFGKSPEAYAKEIASVLEVSRRENFLHLLHIMIAIFGFFIVVTLIDGPLHVSLIELTGYPIGFALWVIFTVIALRTTSFKKETAVFFITWLYMLVPAAFTLGIVWLDRMYGETVLTVEGLARYILGGVLAMVLIINLASLFNWTFGVIHVLLVLGSLALFEYLELEKRMPGMLRFVLPIVISWLLWRYYGRKLALRKMEKRKKAA